MAYILTKNTDEPVVSSSAILGFSRMGSYERFGEETYVQAVV